MDNIFKVIKFLKIFTGNKVSNGFLIYKIIIAIFMICNQITRGYRSFVVHGKDFRQFAFLTVLSFLFINISVIFDSALVIARFVKEKQMEKSKSQENEAKPHFEQCNFILKLSMYMTDTSFPTAFLITLVYYGTLFEESFDNLTHYTDAAAHLFQVRIN